MRFLAAATVALTLPACGASGPSPQSQRTLLLQALKHYAHDQDVFVSEFLHGLGRLNLSSAHVAAAQLRTGIERFDATVRSMSVPASAQRDAHALVLADQRQAADLAQAAAAPALSGVVLAIGRWAKDGGPQLTLAIRLREELKR